MSSSQIGFCQYSSLETRGWLAPGGGKATDCHHQKSLATHETMEGAQSGHTAGSSMRARGVEATTSVSGGGGLGRDMKSRQEREMATGSGPLA